MYGGYGKVKSTRVQVNNYLRVTYYFSEKEKFKN